MASITKKIKKGRPYYYAVESKRIDGKPRIVWQKYLGTLDAIINRAEESKPPKPKHTVIFEAGGIAALLRITQRLKLIELINEVSPKREQGPTVGHYIILAALNRALEPLSKLAIGNWYEQTVLRRLWGFDKSAFTSQRFWDHMDRFSEQDIEDIQERLVPRIEKEFGIDARILLYDTTNFFTFLATTNDRSGLAQRGHSKQKRHDLRQIGLALLVTRDFQIPLFHKVYPGNIPDVSLFPQLTGELVDRYKRVTGKAPEATLVFDKGNVTDDVMEDLVVRGAHFVAALSANQCADLLATPYEEFNPIDGMPGTQAFDTTTIMWGKSCRVVVLYTESFFTQQLQGVTQNLVKCQKKLLDLAKSLERWRQGKSRGKKPSVRSVRMRVGVILSAQFMKNLIQTEVKEDKTSGIPRLSYSVDHTALQRLSQERLGRTVLVSDHTQWSARQVVEAYRSLSVVEDAFKNMKNTDFLRWQPAHHWTDQKLRVHALYCVLALLVSSLARKVAFEAGVNLTLPALLKELSAIREVAVIYPPGTLAHPKDHITLSRMSARQKKLAHALEIGKTLGQIG
ncbi:MAG: IS1634 family transposase [Deltaproteobacteria bacterium]|nr:IS1634 family transposase [Deltaproteobacteria bacterium]MBW2169322.1 IS1634 family transposase [Deltaproteobacteria bacterium]